MSLKTNTRGGETAAGDGSALGRHNRWTILIFDFFWGVALPFVQSTTTMPGYLSALKAPGVLIGLVPAVFSGGLALITPFSLYLIRPGPRRFRKTLGAYRIGAFCYATMGCTALLLPESAVTARVGVFFFFYLCYVLIAGAGDPHYVAMTVASVPDRERGWFFGLKAVWFGIGGLIGGALAGWVLRLLPAPRNFGLSMLCGGLIVLTATIWFRRFKDEKQLESGPRPKLSECLMDVWRLSQRSPSFRRFLCAASLFVFAQSPFAFLALFIKQRLHAGDALLGGLGFLYMGCGLVCALLMGYVGDRFGHRSTFMLGVLFYAAGLAGSLLLTSPFGLLAAYFIACAFNPAWSVAAFNLGYDCAAKADPARVYAGINIVVAPLRIAGPILAGIAADRWGCPPVFAAAAALGGAAILLAYTLPRRSSKGR